MVIFFYSIIAGAVTIAGIQIIIFNERIAKKYAMHFMPFAAGIILATAFFHLIPESIELNEKAIFYVFTGFLLFYLLESSIIISSSRPPPPCIRLGKQPLTINIIIIAENDKRA